MLRYATYVKFSLHGLLWSLDESPPHPDPAKRAALAAQRNALAADFDACIALAAALPRLPEPFFERIFPHRPHRGALGLRINPADAAEILFSLEHFPAHPLARWPGQWQVFPYLREPGTYRIFPYQFRLRFVPDRFCSLSWFFEHQPGRCIPIWLYLPPALFDHVVNPSTGILEDALFVPGLVPHVAQWTNESGRHLTLHFPRAYRPCDDGPGILLTWRDIPLFAALAAERRAA